MDHDVLGALACAVSLLSALAAFAVHWTPEGNSVTVHLPIPDVQEFLIKSATNQAIHALHRVAFMIVCLLNHVALNVHDVSLFC